MDFNKADDKPVKPRKDDSDEYESENDSEENNKISKTIRLKMHKIREELFAYLRSSLMQKKAQSHKEHLLVSTPVDPDFELLVVACAINLLEGLLTARFKTTIQEDEKILQQEDISMRVRFAVMHRLDCKKILTSNINMLQILVRVLANIQF